MHAGVQARRGGLDSRVGAPQLAAGGVGRPGVAAQEAVLDRVERVVVLAHPVLGEPEQPAVAKQAAPPRVLAELVSNARVVHVQPERHPLVLAAEGERVHRGELGAQGRLVQQPPR
jgi:hypothetical protein